MFKRIRDKVINYKPLEYISNDDWVDIKNRNKIATDFFSDKNPIYISMKEALSLYESQILENRIKEVREIHKFNALKKIFITPKKIQEDEVVGQIKFIRNMFAEIQSWIDRMVDIEKREANGLVEIDRDGRGHK